MLAMHLDQRLAQLSQNTDARGLIIDEGPTATVCGQSPAQHQVLVAGIAQTLVLKDMPNRVVWRWRKDRRGHGLSRPATHKSGIGPRACR